MGPGCGPGCSRSWLAGWPAGRPAGPAGGSAHWLAPRALLDSSALGRRYFFSGVWLFFFRCMLIFDVFLLEFCQNGASHWTHLGPILGPRSGSICSCSCLAGWLEGRPARAAWYAADWLAEWRAGWLLGLSWKARLWDHIPFAFQGGRLVFVGSAGFCKTRNLEQLNGA